MSTLIIASILVLSFAAFATAHLLLCARLARRAPHWQGALALFVPFAAPYLAHRVKAHVHLVIWAVALALYLSTLVVSLRLPS